MTFSRYVLSAMKFRTQHINDINALPYHFPLVYFAYVCILNLIIFFKHFSRNSPVICSTAGSASSLGSGVRRFESRVRPILSLVVSYWLKDGQ